MINWRGWDCPACMELNCENLHFPMQDGSLQHYSLNNSLFLVPAFYSLNCSLAGARSQISTTCISKNSKDPYLVLQSHIFKSSVCASDFKIIENRGFKRGKKTQTFLSRCLNCNWFQNHWNNCTERRIETIHSPQHSPWMDGAAETCSKCALCPQPGWLPLQRLTHSVPRLPETALGFCKCQREQEGSWDHFLKTELAFKDRNTCRSFGLVIQH